VRPPIEAALGKEVIALTEDGEERGGDRRHPAAGDERRLRALERSELVLQRNVVRRVVEPDIPESVVGGLALVRERR
jgi:hypothetical protein